jgi:hypothetical protein
LTHHLPRSSAAEHSPVKRNVVGSIPTEAAILFLTTIGENIIMIKVKLADALLRRKELQQKIDVLKNVDAKALYELRVERIKVSDSLDEVRAAVPKLTASQVTQEIDWHSRQLRLIDSAIQQANWTCEIEVAPSTMQQYTDVN